jgi:hypothetical protein
LLEDGVAPEIIELMDLRYGCLSKMDEGYRELVKSAWMVGPIKSRGSWNEYMRKTIDTLSQMPPADRKLFARVHREIIRKIGDPHSSDVHAWDDKVFEVMKIVREGGGEEEVDKHLEPYGWHYEDEAKRTAYEKKHAEVVGKVVRMIREG